MSVVAKTSTIIANRDSSPSVLTDPAISTGKAQDAMGYCSVANGDSIGSTYDFCQVPSNCRLTSVILACEAITSAAANFGVYNPTKNGVLGSAINASFFAAAQSIASALPGGTQIINAAGNNSIANQELPLWKALGLSADPGGYFDIVATLTAAATAAGNVSMKVSYIP